MIAAKISNATGYTMKLILEVVCMISIASHEHLSRKWRELGLVKVKRTEISSVRESIFTAKTTRGQVLRDFQVSLLRHSTRLETRFRHWPVLALHRHSIPMHAAVFSSTTSIANSIFDLNACLTTTTVNISFSTPCIDFSSCSRTNMGSYVFPDVFIECGCCTFTVQQGLSTAVYKCFV